jgi:nucleoside-diphosphate-sugar epimerase
MRILITGGNGFLGSNMAKNLLNENDVLIVSRNNNNILDFIEDVKYMNTMDSNKIKEFDPEVVIHCAWSGGNSYSDSNSLNQIHDNIPQCIELLNLITELKTKPHFIGFGSFSEYGKLTKKATEKDREDPINLYGVSKNSFKNISKVHCEQNDILWSWIRPCYIYGPGDVHTRLIPSLINNILNKEEVNLYDSNTTIDYLYIDDFCEAISKIIEFKSEGIFNICSNEEHNLSDIIKYIIKNTSADFEVNFDKSISRKYSSNYICGSNERLKSKTNWRPKVKIYEGLNRTINYYKKKIKHND